MSCSSWCGIVYRCSLALRIRLSLRLADRPACKSLRLDLLSEAVRWFLARHLLDQGTYWGEA